MLKVPSVTQLEKLAKLIRSKQNLVQITDTDPGVGSSLDAGEILAVTGDTGLIETADIANGAVTADKLASNAVTKGKIASQAVTSDNIDWTTMGIGACDVLYEGGEVQEATLSKSVGPYNLLSVSLLFPNVKSGIGEEVNEDGFDSLLLDYSDSRVTILMWAYDNSQTVVMDNAGKPVWVQIGQKAYNADNKIRLQWYSRNEYSTKSPKITKVLGLKFDSSRK